MGGLESNALYVGSGSNCEMPRPNRCFRFALETGSLPRLFDHLVGAADVNWCWFRLVYASDGGYPFAWQKLR
jgi:hypothetical protein